MTSNLVQRSHNYFSFLLRAWKATDESGATVWRFALVAPTDGRTYRLKDARELLQFLGVETKCSDGDETSIG